jgi:hypothetical protein
VKEPGDQNPKPVFLSRDLPKLDDRSWTKLRVRVIDDTATMTIGDQTLKVKHPSVARTKTVAKIGFAFGEFKIRRFDLDAID